LGKRHTRDCVRLPATYSAFTRQSSLYTAFSRRRIAVGLDRRYNCDHPSDLSALARPTAMPHRHTLAMPSLRALRRWLVAGNVMVAAVVSGAAWVSLDNARQGDENAARLTAQNLAGSMSSEVSAEFRLIDNALETVADRFSGVHDFGSASRLLADMLTKQRSLLRHVEALRVADRDGRVVQGLAAGAPPMDVADRDNFLKAKTTSETVISEPIQSKLTGKWVVSVSRSLRRPGGQFAGVVFAVISSDHFADLFSGMELGTSGAMSIRTAGSLRLVARHSAQEPRSSKGLGEVSC